MYLVLHALILWIWLLFLLLAVVPNFDCSNYKMDCKYSSSSTSYYDFEVAKTTVLNIVFLLEQRKTPYT